MRQRCSYCGKTERQHGGRPCVDQAGLRRALNAVQKPPEAEGREYLPHEREQLQCDWERQTYERERRKGSE
jgi:hypothetical protein